MFLSNEAGAVSFGLFISGVLSKKLELAKPSESTFGLIMRRMCFTSWKAMMMKVITMTRVVTPGKSMAAENPLLLSPPVASVSYGAT